MPKPYTSKNLTLAYETPKFMWASMAKLVPQLPGVVTFAYELRLGCTIACWKGIDEELHLGGAIRAFKYH